MEKSEESVARYYDTAIFEAELVRLTRDSTVERGVTLRWLERLAPDAVEVAEIGAAADYIRNAWRAKVAGCIWWTCRPGCSKPPGNGCAPPAWAQPSPEPAASLATGAFDAALLLGPLYHLCSADARRQAVAEAARILKPGGWLFAAGINRLSYLRDLLRDSPEKACQRRAFHQQYLRNGNLDPEHAPPIGFAHLTTIAEFRALFANTFEDVALVGGSPSAPPGRPG